VSGAPDSRSNAPKTENAVPVQVALRPVALPTPLGYLGLVMGALLLAAYHFRLVPAEDAAKVGALLFAVAVPLQLLAALGAMSARDTIGSLASGVLGAIWAATALSEVLGPPGSPSDALGVVQVAGFVALTVPVAVAVQSRPVPAAVIAMAGIHFLATGVYELTGSDTGRYAAASIGLAVAAVALYGAAALTLEEAKGRRVLPLGRRRAGDAATRGSFAEQVEGIEHAPGVRKGL